MARTRRHHRNHRRTHHGPHRNLRIQDRVYEFYFEQNVVANFASAGVMDINMQVSPAPPGGLNQITYVTDSSGAPCVFNWQAGLGPDSTAANAAFLAVHLGFDPSRITSFSNFDNGTLDTAGISTAFRWWKVKTVTYHFDFNVAMDTLPGTASSAMPTMVMRRDLDGPVGPVSGISPSEQNYDFILASDHVVWHERPMSGRHHVKTLPYFMDNTANYNPNGNGTVTAYAGTLFYPWLLTPSAMNGGVTPVAWPTDGRYVSPALALLFRVPLIALNVPYRYPFQIRRSITIIMKDYLGDRRF